MQYLARSCANPAELDAQAYNLYCKFRPSVPEGRAGWGAKGVLDLGLIERMAIANVRAQAAAAQV
jgi:hypothetical protein